MNSIQPDAPHGADYELVGLSEIPTNWVVGKAHLGADLAERLSKFAITPKALPNNSPTDRTDERRSGACLQLKRLFLCQRKTYKIQISSSGEE